MYPLMCHTQEDVFMKWLRVCAQDNKVAVSMYTGWPKTVTGFFLFSWEESLPSSFVGKNICAVQTVAQKLALLMGDRSQLTATHIVHDSRSELFWETLSKPQSEKATHGNHVYFFPLTSFPLHRLHQQDCREHTSRRGHALSTMLTKTHRNSRVRGTTGDPQNPRAKTAPLSCFSVLERSEVPLEEFQQGGETRPNCARRVFSLSTALTWGSSRRYIFTRPQ